MKTLHLYLVRQVLTTLVMTIAVFTFVLMLGSVLKDVLGHLVNGQASLPAVAKAIGLLIPYSLPYALPMGLLTATLLVFGRFSADHELTAARAGGVSLIALVSPVLLLSVALSGVTAFINMQLAPQCRVAYKELLNDIRNVRPATFFPERTYSYFDSSIVYVGKIHGSNLQDVFIYTLNKSNQMVRYVRAEGGVYSVNLASNKLYVTLTGTHVTDYKDGAMTPGDASETSFEYDLRPPKGRANRDISEMTFWELMDEWRELERRMAVAPVPGQPTNEELRAALKQLRAAKRHDLASPVRVRAHRQMSFSFSCIAFTLIGIPLGIRAHRRETTFGIAAALVLVMFYYGFFVLGQALETRTEWAPHLILWIPNFLFQTVGAVLLWRANRGV